MDTNGDRKISTMIKAILVIQIILLIITGLGYIDYMKRSSEYQQEIAKYHQIEKQYQEDMAKYQKEMEDYIAQKKKYDEDVETWKKAMSVYEEKKK